MPTRTVDLTEHLQAFIDSGVSAGRYQDASDVVREGLRLLELREEQDRARLDWLRGAAEDASASLARGEGRCFESVDEAVLFVKEARRRVAKDASGGVASPLPVRF